MDKVFAVAHRRQLFSKNDLLSIEEEISEHLEQPFSFPSDFVAFLSKFGSGELGSFLSIFDPAKSFEETEEAQEAWAEAGFSWSVDKPHSKRDVSKLSVVLGRSRYSDVLLYCHSKSTYFWLPFDRQFGSSIGTSFESAIRWIFSSASLSSRIPIHLCRSSLTFQPDRDAAPPLLFRVECSALLSSPNSTTNTTTTTPSTPLDTAAIVQACRRVHDALHALRIGVGFAADLVVLRDRVAARLEGEAEILAESKAKSQRKNRRRPAAQKRTGNDKLARTGAVADSGGGGGGDDNDNDDGDDQLEDGGYVEGDPMDPADVWQELFASFLVAEFDGRVELHLVRWKTWQIVAHISTTLDYAPPIRWPAKLRTLVQRLTANPTNPTASLHFTPYDYNIPTSIVHETSDPVRIRNHLRRNRFLPGVGRVPSSALLALSVAADHGGPLLSADDLDCGFMDTVVLRGPFRSGYRAIRDRLLSLGLQSSELVDPQLSVAEAWPLWEEYGIIDEKIFDEQGNVFAFKLIAESCMVELHACGEVMWALVHHDSEDASSRKACGRASKLFNELGFVSVEAGGFSRSMLVGSDSESMAN